MTTENQNSSGPAPVSAPVSRLRSGGRWPWVIAALVIAALGVTSAYFIFKSAGQQSEIEDLKNLAELDKQEMADQYREFDIQYGELQKQIRNDSLLLRIDEERERARRLLKELEQTKATDAREIARLKKEIASLRAVLKSYIVQVDSLNRANADLREENANVKAQVVEATTQISQISSERNVLRDKVDKAAQLDATGFWVTPRNKRGREERKVAKVTSFAFGFTIVKNVTAQNGQRTVYARILKPDNSVFKPMGTFAYENTSVEYTEKKYIEYTGEEQKITMYSDVTEYLEAGTYRLFIFADGQMVGQTSFTLN